MTNTNLANLNESFLFVGFVRFVFALPPTFAKVRESLLMNEHESLESARIFFVPAQL